MSKLKQSILKAIRELTLLDDAFMTKVFEDDIKQAQFLLRILFNDDTIKVKSLLRKSVLRIYRAEIYS